MRLITTIAIAFILSFPTVGIAQVGVGAEYFPLEVGNSWTFIEIIDPPFSPPDTVRQFTSTIVGTELISDTLYFAFDRGLVVSRYWRTDGQGRYWGRVAGLDQLVMDFNIAETDTTRLFLGDNSFPYFNVIISEPDSLSVSAGSFKNVRTVGFNAPDGWVDASPSVAFAPGVGPIVLVGSMGEWEQLLSANVSGNIITSVDVMTEVMFSPQVVSPYPNPFQASISFSLKKPTRERIPHVSIYNVMGQKVARLAPVLCSSIRCDFTWDASELSSGSYFLQPNFQTDEVITPVVLVR